MPVFRELPKALRWLRLQADRKQQDVAQAAGITPSMLSSFEQGKRTPSLASLGKLLEGLEVDLPQLAEALRQVREGPVVGVAGGGGAAPSPPRRPALTAGEPGTGAGGRPPLLDLNRALGVEPLSSAEETALRQLVEGFLEWLRVLRIQARPRP